MKKRKTKDKNKNSKKKIIAIAIFVITTIATIIITWSSEEIRYLFSPKIETDLDATWAHYIARINGENGEIYNYKDYPSCYIESYIENNSDDAVTIKNIKVVVEEFIDYKKLIFDESPLGGKGTVKEPFYVEARLKSGFKQIEAIPKNKDQYLVVESHDAEIVALLFYPTDRGLYTIHVEYSYNYHGKTRNIKTKSQQFLFTNGI